MSNSNSFNNPELIEGFTYKKWYEPHLITLFNNEITGITDRIVQPIQYRIFYEYCNAWESAWFQWKQAMLRLFEIWFEE